METSSKPGNSFSYRLRNSVRSILRPKIQFLLIQFYDILHIRLYRCANPNALKTHKQLPFGLESRLKVILWLVYGFTMVFTMVYHGLPWFTMVYHGLPHSPVALSRTSPTNCACRTARTLLPSDPVA